MRIEIMGKSDYYAILKRRGSKCTCPICGRLCQGGSNFMKTGKLDTKNGIDIDKKGCRHYDGWSWDVRNKVMSHYFVK